MRFHRLWPAAFLALLASCSTFVNISYTKPARIAIGGVDSIAVLIKSRLAAGLASSSEKTGTGEAAGSDFSGLIYSLAAENGMDLVPEAEKLIAALFLSELSASGLYRTVGPLNYDEKDKWSGKADSFIVIEVLEADSRDAKSLDLVSGKDGSITEFDVFDRFVHLRYRYEALDAKGESLGSSELEGNLTSTALQEKGKLESPESLLEQIVRNGRRPIRENLVPSDAVWTVSLLQDPDPRMREAEELAGRGKWSEASDLYKSLGEAGGNREALFNYGLIQFYLGNRSAGIEAARGGAESRTSKELEAILKRMEEISAGEASMQWTGSGEQCGPRGSPR